jgi:hypothetical protein
MNDDKYIGLDVHQATITAAVLEAAGKLVMEAILETKAETILQFIRGLRGSLHVTLEEGTSAAWLHDLLKPHVTEVLVCDSRKNALLKSGNRNDRVDARKLAELLYLKKLNPVNHGETGVRTVRELARSYLAITRDLTRVTQVYNDKVGLQGSHFFESVYNVNGFATNLKAQLAFCKKPGDFPTGLAVVDDQDMFRHKKISLYVRRS